MRFRGAIPTRWLWHSLCEDIGCNLRQWSSFLFIVTDKAKKIRPPPTHILVLRNLHHLGPDDFGISIASYPQTQVCCEWRIFLHYSLLCYMFMHDILCVIQQEREHTWTVGVAKYFWLKFWFLFVNPSIPVPLKTCSLSKCSYFRVCLMRGSCSTIISQ